MAGFHGRASGVIVEIPDCHLLQGRPIQLRFFLARAKLYSLEATNRHNHYLQSYK